MLRFVRRRFRATVLAPLIAFGSVLLTGCGLLGFYLTPVSQQLPELSVPQGFAVELVYEGLEKPRLMAMGPGGAVIVAEMDADRASALVDDDGDGTYDRRVTLVDNVDRPNSVVFRDGQLFVAADDAIVRVDVADDLSVSNRTTVIPNLPDDGNHFSKTLAIGPDGRLYVASGSTCNVCEESDPRRAAITVYEPDGSGGRTFVSGMRNAVGLAFNPTTDVLWATNNGRDLMGAETPPETVYALSDGMDAGFPYCHAGNVPDPDFGDAAGGDPCAGVAMPDVTMTAHMAPMALLFYDGDQFPASFDGDMFVALRGSWNRPDPAGYKVMRVPMAGGNVAGPAEDFLTGFLTEANAPETRGRPVGLLVDVDGSLLVTDDTNGRVYRVRYVGE